jgi:hypothetical protein
MKKIIHYTMKEVNKENIKSPEETLNLAAIELAASLEKLLQGLAKDGVAIEGFIDGWAALKSFREAQLSVAIQSKIDSIDLNKK